ncbi:MAG: hypothetical protein GWP14_10700 [Actinobacteria bacterium]|nr:hypothetical protein [Actinomycetota bacterium]
MTPKLGQAAHESVLRSLCFSELPVHDTVWSINTGADGNIYMGVCGELTGGLSVFLVRYDPRKDQVEYLLEVSPALGEPTDSGRAPHAKIHYCLIGAADGKLYCATHYSGPGLGNPIWRPFHTWDDPERMAEGFHIFSYDPVTESLEDFGIMSPNEGSRAMALAQKRGLLYGITWPRDHFYVYDLNRRKYSDLGRIGDTNAQVVWTDPEENGYTVNDLGFIIKYDADQGRLVELKARLPIDPEAPLESRSVYDVVAAPDGQSVYGIVWNCEHRHNPSAERLFRYEFKENKVTDLGAGYGKDKTDHLGGLVFADDGYLYYAASKKCLNRRLPYKMHLFRMDTETLAKEEICPIDDGDWNSEYIAKATKDAYGNLYFADTNNRPPRVYIYRPKGLSGNFTSSKVPTRNWG